MRKNTPLPTDADIKRLMKKRQRNLHEGKGVVYSLISSAHEELETAMKMAKKNKKMKSMVPALKKAIDAIGRIE